MAIRVLALLTGFGTAVGALAWSDTTDRELLLAVRHRVLFERLGLTCSLASDPEHRVTHAHRLTGERISRLQYTGFIVEVFATSQGAMRRFREYASKTMVGTSWPTGEAPIGDECVHTAGTDPAPVSGALLVRRENVVFRIAWAGPWEEVVALARDVDSLLQSDREVAPLGTFDPPPRIVETGIPQTLRVRDKIRHEYLTRSGRFTLPPFDFVRFAPRIEGMGPMERLRIWVRITGTGQDIQKVIGRNQVRQDGKSLPHVYVPVSHTRAQVRAKTPSRDGRFILRVSVPDEPVTCKLTMTVVNDDNLVVTKEETIQIVPD